MSRSSERAPGESSRITMISDEAAAERPPTREPPTRLRRESVLIGESVRRTSIRCDALMPVSAVTMSSTGVSPGGKRIATERSPFGAHTEPWTTRPFFAFSSSLVELEHACAARPQPDVTAAPPASMLKERIESVLAVKRRKHVAYFASHASARIG
eukprot:scaffold235848_cov33-Tisochrysis_lutea.AAC.2